MPMSRSKGRHTHKHTNIPSYFKNTPKDWDHNVTFVPFLV